MDIDQQWIVTKHFTLCKTFLGHNNGKVGISRLACIKYPFKYACKGEDWVTIWLQNEIVRQDETMNVVDDRSVSELKTAQRILGPRYADSQLLIAFRDVYLKGYHTVSFQEGNE